MEKLLRLLELRKLESDQEIAAICGISLDEFYAQIKAWEEDETIVGHQAVINHNKREASGVKAFIEVKIKPETGGGYDRLAHRIARFNQVISCTLFSGDYDLLLEVEVESNLGVATFVFDTLSKIDGVISTRTHFPLKTYKLKGIHLKEKDGEERLPVSP